MKKAELRQIIREELQTVLTEAGNNTVLYRVAFKPEYSLESDSSNKSIQPIFVQMTMAERTKIAQYAAIDKISGLGNTTYDALPASKRLDGKEMSFQEAMKLIKNLQKVKIHK